VTMRNACPVSPSNVLLSAGVLSASAFAEAIHFVRQAGVCLTVASGSLFHGRVAYSRQTQGRRPVCDAKHATIALSGPGLWRRFKRLENQGKRMAPQVGLESTLKRSFNNMQSSGWHLGP